MPSYSRRVGVPGKSSSELFEILSKDIHRFIEKLPVGNVDIKKNAADKALQLKASMFSATLNCQEEAVELKAQLSLLAAPFRSKIDESIDRWLAKIQA